MIDLEQWRRYASERVRIKKKYKQDISNEVTMLESIGYLMSIELTEKNDKIRRDEAFRRIRVRNLQEHIYGTYGGPTT